MIKLKISAASPGDVHTGPAENGAAGFRLLDQCPLFKDLTKEIRHELVMRAEKVTFSREAVLFRAGEPASAVFALVSGRVKICQPRAHGEEIVVQLLGAGELCGWPCVLVDGIQTTTAKAVEAGQALALARTDFEELLQRVPTLAGNAIRVLARRVSELQDHYLELATEHVAQRLARTLLRLGGPDGNVPLSRAELAQMTGTTLFTVSRVLSVWDRQGVVKARRGHVLLESPRRLGRIAKEHPSSAPRALAAQQGR